MDCGHLGATGEAGGIAEVKPTETCLRCKGKRTIQVLGCGGDYETWSCPDCRPEEAYRPDPTEIPDGEAD